MTAVYALIMRNVLLHSLATTVQRWYSELTLELGNHYDRITVEIGDEINLKSNNTRIHWKKNVCDRIFCITSANLCTN